MADRINIRFTYTAEEFAAAYRFYYRKEFWGIREGLISCALILIGLFLHVRFHSPFGMWAIITGALFLILVPLLTWILPFWFFRTEPMLREEYRLDMSADDIHFTTSKIDSHLKWTLYKDVWQNDRFYLLLYGKRSYTAIPKRAFASPEDRAQFEAWLTTLFPTPPKGR